MTMPCIGLALDNLLAVWCMWAGDGAMMLPSALRWCWLSSRCSSQWRNFALAQFVVVYLWCGSHSAWCTGLQWLLQAAAGQPDDRQHLGHAHGSVLLVAAFTSFATQARLPCKLPHADGLS